MHQFTLSYQRRNEKFSRKYEGYDYIARKQEDGNYEIHVSEHQTKMIDREMKLKKPTSPRRLKATRTVHRFKQGFRTNGK